jgi:hypothetical protein
VFGDENKVVMHTSLLSVCGATNKGIAFERDESGARHDDSCSKK